MDIYLAVLRPPPGRAGGGFPDRDTVSAALRRRNPVVGGGVHIAHVHVRPRRRSVGSLEGVIEAVLFVEGPERAATGLGGLLACLGATSGDGVLAGWTLTSWRPLPLPSPAEMSSRRPPAEE